ncbi:MAG: D-tyrosyl-tRNA(Tyr) deacylase [Deltaproteobacteria bacterium RBG_13_61_14]|nr:MAG: D-tyrosyl-tRNA(Tyr) deacylase [Deltaproteobacteria bacterium RBG_13_61_14]
MRAVLQRVSQARVKIAGETVAEIGSGLLVLAGVFKGDAEADADYLAQKTAELRIFEDAAGKMNLSVLDRGDAVLVVSQFTLAADVRKGRRPSFDPAAPPEEAERLYLLYADRLRARGLAVKTGVFGARMEVELVNDGPVTFVLESLKSSPKV